MQCMWSLSVEELGSETQSIVEIQWKISSCSHYLKNSILSMLYTTESIPEFLSSYLHRKISFFYCYFPSVPLFLELILFQWVFWEFLCGPYIDWCCCCCWLKLSGVEQLKTAVLLGSLDKALSSDQLSKSFLLLFISLYLTWWCHLQDFWVNCFVCWWPS